MTIYQTVQSTTDVYLKHNAIGHSYNTPLEKSSKIIFYLIIDIYNLAALASNKMKMKTADLEMQQSMQKYHTAIPKIKNKF